jgi:hypothetical protein
MVSDNEKTISFDQLRYMSINNTYGVLLVDHKKWQFRAEKLTTVELTEVRVSTNEYANFVACTPNVMRVTLRNIQWLDQASVSFEMRLNEGLGHQTLRRFDTTSFIAAPDAWCLSTPREIFEAFFLILKSLLGRSSCLEHVALPLKIADDFFSDSPRITPPSSVRTLVIYLSPDEVGRSTTEKDWGGELRQLFSLFPLITNLCLTLPPKIESSAKTARPDEGIRSDHLEGSKQIFIRCKQIYPRLDVLRLEAVRFDAVTLMEIAKHYSAIRLQQGVWSWRDRFAIRLKKAQLFTEDTQSRFVAEELAMTEFKETVERDVEGCAVIIE